MGSRAQLRIGFVGDGGISRSVRDTLLEECSIDFTVTGVLCRPHATDELSVFSVEQLLATKPDVVVECAGHGAVAEFGPRVLEAGVPLMIVSVGALADEQLLARLRGAADAGNSRVVLAPGAMAGIDALAAAQLGGLTRVRYTGRKPPLAWKGTPAEGLFDLTTLDLAQTFYRGTARKAALTYPKNSNVAATIALAGLGFDRTEVELVADPGVSQNVHELMFEGADGRFEIVIRGKPSRSNPKTSALTAHSVVRLLCGMASPLVI